MSSLYRLYRELFDPTNEIELTKICFYCDKKFSSRNKLFIHLKENPTHKNQEEWNPKYFCFGCGKLLRKYMTCIQKIRNKNFCSD